MNNWEEKWMDYIDGNLSENERHQFEQETYSDPVKHQAFIEMQEMDGLLNSMDDFKTNPKMQVKFDNYLKSQESSIKEKDSKPKMVQFKKPVLKNLGIAASVLIAGILVGTWMSNDPVKVQSQSNQYQLVNNLMEESSPMKRIQGVNVSHKTKNPDWNVAELLINTLKNDESSNVRMAAVKGLKKFLSEETTRIELIQALDTETDASVKIAIINLLSSAKEQRAIEPLQKIIGNDIDLKFVKEEAEIGLMHINSI